MSNNKKTSAAPILDFSAEQPSPSQTPTSTASDGAHRAPLKINNTPIVTRSMLSVTGLYIGISVKVKRRGLDPSSTQSEFLNPVYVSRFDFMRHFDI